MTSPISSIYGSETCFSWDETPRRNASNGGVGSSPDMASGDPRCSLVNRNITQVCAGQVVHLDVFGRRPRDARDAGDDVANVGAEIDRDQRPVTDEGVSQGFVPA